MNRSYNYCCSLFDNINQQNLRTVALHLDLSIMHCRLCTEDQGQILTRLVAIGAAHHALHGPWDELSKFVNVNNLQWNLQWPQSAVKSMVTQKPPALCSVKSRVWVEGNGFLRKRKSCGNYTTKVFFVCFCDSRFCFCGSRFSSQFAFFCTLSLFTDYCLFVFFAGYEWYVCFLPGYLPIPI